MLSIGLFFSGFFEETRIVVYGVVTGVTAVERTVVIAVVVVVVVVVVAVNIVRATAL